MRDVFHSSHSIPLRSGSSQHGRLQRHGPETHAGDCLPLSGALMSLLPGAPASMSALQMGKPVPGAMQGNVHGGQRGHGLCT